MAQFAGLDVSVRVTSICIVDESGKVIRETKVPSEPAALLAALKGHAATLRRVGAAAAGGSRHGRARLDGDDGEPDRRALLSLAGARA